MFLIFIEVEDEFIVFDGRDSFGGIDEVLFLVFVDAHVNVECFGPGEGEDDEREKGGDMHDESDGSELVGGGWWMGLSGCVGGCLDKAWLAGER